MAGHFSETLNYVATGHEQTLLSNLHKQQIAREFCDVTLKVEHREYSAHKAVLSASSPYFHAMFVAGMQESQKSCIDLHGVDSNIFSRLLDFIYTGKLDVSEDICQDLFAAASMLQLSGAIEACSRFLIQQLHSSNAIGIYHFAGQNGCHKLVDASEQYILANFASVTEEDEFYDIPVTTLIFFLQSEHIQVENEYHVLCIAMKWILHDVSPRRKHIYEILKPVRFPIISTTQLEEYISECTDLSLKIALQKLSKDFHKVEYLSALRPYMFTPRTRARKRVFVVGGYNREEGGSWSDSHSLTTMECFDTFSEEWQILPSMQYCRSGHGVCALQGKVYAIGGENDSLIFENGECYDPTRNRWEEIAWMNEPRCGLGVVVVEDEIYAIGGWVGSEIGQSMEKYNPVSDTWTVIGNVLTVRFSMGLVECEGEIYVLGGMSDQGTELRIMEKYDPAYKQWRTLASMAEPRAYVGVAVLGSFIYAVGGWNEEDGSLSSVERYHTDKDMWESIAPMKCERAGASVAAVNGLLYVIGGRQSYGDRSMAPTTRDTVEVYDPNTGKWTELEMRMPTGRCDTGVAVI